MRLGEPDPGLFEQPPGLAELRPAAARMGVDDEHGFAGNGTHGLHPQPTHGGAQGAAKRRHGLQKPNA
jgi:hypothetical protein